MILEITTPAFLFSTVSLLMSAYIGRFSAIASLIRELSSKREDNDVMEDEYYKKQMGILFKRITYIRYLHCFGVFSLFSSTAAMFFLLFKVVMIANITFAAAIVFFLSAIITAVIESYYSMEALDIKLKI